MTILDEQRPVEEEPKKEIPIWFQRISGSNPGSLAKNPSWTFQKDFQEGKETKLILNELYDATKMTHNQLNKVANELLIKQSEDKIII